MDSGTPVRLMQHRWLTPSSTAEGITVSSMTPATAMSCLFARLQRLATPTTTLPCSDCPSKQPSPENTTSASFTRSSKCAVSSTVWMPICSGELKNATMPAPMPPAAPPPFTLST